MKIHDIVEAIGNAEISTDNAAVAAASSVAVAAGAGFLSAVKESTADATMGLFGDSIKEWRQRRLLATLARTAEILKEQGVSSEDMKALPNGDVYRIFEGCSKEDSEPVSEMWARLLAGQMTSTENNESRWATSILAELSHTDALLFRYLVLFEASQTTAFSKRLKMAMPRDLEDRMHAAHEELLGHAPAIDPSFDRSAKVLLKHGLTIVQLPHRTIFSKLNRAETDLLTVREIGDQINERFNSLLDRESDDGRRAFSAVQYAQIRPTVPLRPNHVLTQLGWDLASLCISDLPTPL